MRRVRIGAKATCRAADVKNNTILFHILYCFIQYVCQEFGTQRAQVHNRSWLCRRWRCVAASHGATSVEWRRGLCQCFLISNCCDDLCCMVYFQSSITLALRFPFPNTPYISFSPKSRSLSLSISWFEREAHHKHFLTTGIRRVDSECLACADIADRTYLLCMSPAN